MDSVHSAQPFLVIQHSFQRQTSFWGAAPTHIPLLNKPENRSKVADRGNPDCTFHSYRFAAAEVSGRASSMKASRKRLKVPLVKTKPARSRSEAVLKLFEGPLVQVGWWMGCIYCLKLLRCERQ